MFDFAYPSMLFCLLLIPILWLYLAKFKKDLDFFDAVKQGAIEPPRCEKCEYCKQTKVLREPTNSEDFYLDM